MNGCAKRQCDRTLGRKKCHDCATRPPHYGFAADKVRRWCAPCSKAHPGAIGVGVRLCEDCNERRPVCGMESEKRKRWCKHCAQWHE